ncbi:MAG: hypothetical protein AB8B74_02540 [Crocinitomicaceae bacterium]
MKSLCLLAIGAMILGFSIPVHGQTMKEKLEAQKAKLLSQSKKGRVCAPDLTDQQVLDFLGGPVPDDGIISTFHQANIGKVVFTKKKIAPKDITAADVVTEFSINDPIYFTFFMDKSFRNQVLFPLNTDGSGFNTGWCWDYSFKKFYPESNGSGVPKLNLQGYNMVYVEMDGKQITEVPFYLAVNSSSTETAFTGSIATDPSIIVPRPEWMDFMRDLAEGNHSFKVEIAGFSLKAGMTKKVAATGDFTLKKKAGEKYSPVMGKSWSDYTAKMKDAKLTAKALASVKDYGHSNKYAEKFIKVKIESRDWVITRTKTLSPVITGRYIVALCYTTWPDGMCKVQRYLFRQNYNGSGYSSTLLCRGVYNNDFPQAIDCD